MGPGRGCGEAGQPLTPARGCAARARPRRLRAAPDRTPPTPGWAVPPLGRAARSAYSRRRSRPPASLLPCPQRHRSAPGTQAAAAGPAAPNMAAATAGPRLFPPAAAGNIRSGQEREGGLPPSPGHRLRVNSGNAEEGRPRGRARRLDAEDRASALFSEIHEATPGAPAPPTGLAPPTSAGSRQFPETPEAAPRAESRPRPRPAPQPAAAAAVGHFRQHPRPGEPRVIPSSGAESHSSLLSVSFRVFSDLGQGAGSSWACCFLTNWKRRLLGVPAT